MSRMHNRHSGLNCRHSGLDPESSQYRPQEPPSPVSRGFTLVELSIAMAFLGILLITIAILVIRIISIYQSGLAIRAVSSTGRQLISEFTRSISGSPIGNVGFDFSVGSRDRQLTGRLSNNPSPADLTYKYYFQITGRADVAGETEQKVVPLTGAFCTGLYTYIWNTAYAFDTDSNSSTFGSPTGAGSTYKYGSTTLSNFRLIRIADSQRDICIAQRTKSGEVNNEFRSFETTNDQGANPPYELLESAEDGLALYDLRIFPTSNNRITGHSFYSGTFILATLRGGVNILRPGDYCAAEYDNLNTDFNYCAINKFNFAMRATGESVDAGEGGYGER